MRYGHLRSSRVSSHRGGVGSVAFDAREGIWRLHEAALEHSDGHVEILYLGHHW